MIGITISFNGEVTVTLKGVTEEEKQLLGLAFNGKSVRDIKPGPDGAMILVLQTSDAKKEIQR